VIRASSHPFAGAYTFLDGHKFIIWHADWTGAIGQEVCAVEGQIVSVGQDTITASTGRGFLIITEYESKAKIKNTRQRFEGGR
jgi:methionyl-tRNA formyltransferase